MYIRRKLYSNIEGEMVPVEQTTLFSAKDDAKGAAAGAGTLATGAGLAAGIGAGSTKIAGKLQAKRIAEAQKEGVMVAGPGKLEKYLRNSGESIKKVGRMANKHKLAAGAIAAGTLAAGAGTGVGISRLKGKKAEEKVYSVLMTEEELRIFAEVAKDAGIGAGVATGAALTAGGAALATKGAGKLERKLAKGRVLKAVAEKNEIMKEAGEKAKSEAKKWAGKKGVQKDMVKNAIDSGKAKASKVKISEAGKIEKGLAAISKGGAAATKWVKANPKLAAGIAAGTIATGAGVGAGVGAIKDKK